MEIVYYIYALDIDADHITAALSCSDKKTTRQAYRLTSEKMKVKDGVNEFYFGCDEINVDKARFRSQCRSIESFVSCNV